MSVVFTFQPLLAAIPRRIFKVLFPTVGESFLKPPSSSNPLATSLALTSLPFHHRTHVVEIHVWPVSSTSSKVSKSLSFCSSTCLAATHSGSLCLFLGISTKSTSSIPLHISLSSKSTHFCRPESSTILNQNLYCPVAFPALPVTLASTHPSPHLYWILLSFFSVLSDPPAVSPTWGTSTCSCITSPSSCSWGSLSWPCS